MYGFDKPNFFEKYKFQVGPIANKDYFRMLSSGFLHVDYMHLLFNMLTLYFFAPIVIESFGRYEFIGMYILSLLAGNALSYYMHRSDFFYSAVGASGAVSGILFSSILVYPFSTIYVFFIPMPAIIFGVLYMVYSIFGMKNQWGNIGHAAHIGGAFMGLILSVLYKPGLLQTHGWIFFILVLPLVLMLVYRKKLNL
jgi:membrane associated rhomboid family serine protease